MWEQLQGGRDNLYLNELKSEISLTSQSIQTRGALERVSAMVEGADSLVRRLQTPRTT